LKSFVAQRKSIWAIDGSVFCERNTYIEQEGR
jgi:hypothetical protein